SYHKLVAQRVKGLEASIDRQCKGGLNDALIVQEKLDDLSQTILMMIYGRPSMARLTRIADSFALGQSVGCSGADSVGDHDGSRTCPVSRDHHGKQGPRQSKESIAFKATTPYVPRPGK